MLRRIYYATTTLGFRRAIKQLRLERTIQRMHKRSIRKARIYADQTNLKINCGCGLHGKPGWVNVDLEPSADLQLDLREKLPFSDNSAEIIYSEHLVEHLAYPGDVETFFRESLRVLRPGGVFRVGVPDTEWPLRAYSDDTENYFELARKKWHPSWCVTKIDSINYHFRQGTEHKYAWDCESLCRVLLETGFARAERRAFDPDLDLPDRELGTLYVDAIKGE